MAKTSENNHVRGDSKPQDSTNRLPMVDLKIATEIVTQIREKAVETAPMDSVAVALGYSSATSTPFYRRIAAARMFNLLSSKSSLTQAAIDYIRPHDEEMKSRILKDAVLGIAGYKDLLTRYAGKKLNVEMVKNSIAKDNNLTDGCALACAKAFETSLTFAGMMNGEGIVLSQGAEVVRDSGGGEQKLPPPPTKTDESPNGTHAHTLYLDRDKSRSFGFTGPLEITRAEYERICRWLEFTMLIAEEKKEA